MTGLPHHHVPTTDGSGEPPVVDVLTSGRGIDRRTAVSELFTIYYAPLVRMARCLVDDVETAEDVVMDAFTALYRRWHAVRDPGDAYRYLRSSVLNGSRSRLRRTRTRRTYDPTLMPIAPAADDSDRQRVDRLSVLESLRGLPRRQRQVLALRYYLDLSEAEIAAELGISAGSVKTHASRGLAALAREWGDSR